MQRRAWAFFRWAACSQCMAACQRVPHNMESTPQYVAAIGPLTRAAWHRCSVLIGSGLPTSAAATNRLCLYMLPRRLPHTQALYALCAALRSAAARSARQWQSVLAARQRGQRAQQRHRRWVCFAPHALRLHRLVCGDRRPGVRQGRRTARELDTVAHCSFCRQPWRVFDSRASTKGCASAGRSLAFVAVWHLLWQQACHMPYTHPSRCCQPTSVPGKAPRSIVVPAPMQSADLAKRILYASQLDGWQLGKSRVFLRAGQLAQLEVRVLLAGFCRRLHWCMRAFCPSSWQT